jgi:hypothetical protein
MATCGPVIKFLLVAQGFKESFPRWRGQAYPPSLHPPKPFDFLETLAPGVRPGEVQWVTGGCPAGGRCGLGRKPVLPGLALFFSGKFCFISGSGKRTNSSPRGQCVLHKPCVHPARGRLASWESSSLDIPGTPCLDSIPFQCAHEHCQAIMDRALIPQSQRIPGQAIPAPTNL